MYSRNARHRHDMIKKLSIAINSTTNRNAIMQRHLIGLARLCGLATSENSPLKAAINARP